MSPYLVSKCVNRDIQRIELGEECSQLLPSTAQSDYTTQIRDTADSRNLYQDFVYFQRREPLIVLFNQSLSRSLTHTSEDLCSSQPCVQSYIVLHSPVQSCILIHTRKSVHIHLHTCPETFFLCFFFSLQGVPKKIRLGFCLISRQPSISFSNRFFS